MVLPVLLAVTVGLVWLLSLATAQVRCVDAARETARALARDDPLDVAVGLGQRAAPPGAEVHVSRHGGLVVVRVSSRVAGPGGLFESVPGVDVSAEAAAAAEGQP